jgi:hypothetical protein
MRRALLLAVGARSGAVERVRSGFQEAIEGVERRRRRIAPAASPSGVRICALVAGYALTGRALAEPEEVCSLEHMTCVLGEIGLRSEHSIA